MRPHRPHRSHRPRPPAGGLLPLLLPLGLLGDPAEPPFPSALLPAPSPALATPDLATPEVETWNLEPLPASPFAAELLTAEPGAAEPSGAASPPAWHDAWSSGRPDGHAPIGVMGDHTHHAGEWMFSYRFMRMEMDGNRIGTHRVSAQDVFDLGFTVTPVAMSMDMHMLGVMYAASDDLTWMAMVPWLRLEMDHVTAGGGSFTTRSEGLGDVCLSALRTVWRGERRQVHLNAGLSIPTGSIDEKDQTPMSGGADVQLPYPMQLGSGTFDLRPGVTYVGQSDDWSWGAQGLLTIRLGENDRDYRLGNRAEATGWIARRLSSSWSTSLRLAGSCQGNIHGMDPAPSVNPAVVPTADPNLRGGQRLDVALGLNFLGQKGLLKGQRFALEVGAPVHQDLDGPQLETDSFVTFGWQWAP